MSLYITGKRIMDMTAAQVHELYKLRVDIFVSEQNTPFKEIDDTDAHPGTLHLLALETDGGVKIVGTARIFGKPEEGQHIGRVCVHPDYRGRGIAGQLVDKAIEVCAERAAGIDPTDGAFIVLDAQKHLVDFYRAHGFEVSGEEFEEVGIPHMPMKRSVEPLHNS